MLNPESSCLLTLVHRRKTPAARGSSSLLLSFCLNVEEHRKSTLLVIGELRERMHGSAGAVTSPDHLPVGALKPALTFTLLSRGDN